MNVIVFFLLVFLNVLSSSLANSSETANKDFVLDTDHFLNELCQTNQSCADEKIDAFQEIIDLNLDWQCINIQLEKEAHGLEFPKCNEVSSGIYGFDNTMPTNGLFVSYTVKNDKFIQNLAQTYLKENPNQNAKLNIIVPREGDMYPEELLPDESSKVTKDTYVKKLISLFESNKELKGLLDLRKINLITVASVVSKTKYIQDHFEFIMQDGKLGLFMTLRESDILEHMEEENLDFNTFLDSGPCAIARHCNLPIYLMPKNEKVPLGLMTTLNQGGNLEVLPGETLYTGVIKTAGFRESEIRPYKTEFQKNLKKELEKNGKSLLELDISFLYVGHVDEIVSIVKTEKKAPCNFAVMLASPKKAFELLDKDYSSIKKNKEHEEFCEKYAFDHMYSEYSDEILKKIYDYKCIDGYSLASFYSHEDFINLRTKNLTSTEEQKSYQQIMDENKEALMKSLEQTTKCEDIPIIEVPTAFTADGRAIVPNAVNSLVESPLGHASHVIAPKMYFESFETYLKWELKKHGVGISYIDDMDYHIGNGEIHCATSASRICTL